MRATLNKISNAEERAAKAADRAEQEAATELARAVGILAPKSGPLLQAVNERRRTLGLAAPF